jgi:hypothetical protein
MEREQSKIKAKALKRLLSSLILPFLKRVNGNMDHA